MKSGCTQQATLLAALLGSLLTLLPATAVAETIAPANGIDAYLQRVASQQCDGLSFQAVAMTDGVTVQTRYLPDSSELHLFYPTQFNDLTEGWNWHPEAAGVGNDYYTYKYLPLGSRTEERGVEETVDNFGTHRYPVRWRHDYFIAFDNPYDFYARDADENSGFAAVLPLSPDAAQALLTRPLGLAVQLRLQERCLSDSNTFWEATLSQPVKFSLKKHYLIGRIDSVVFYEQDSGTVLARLSAKTSPAKQADATSLTSTPATASGTATSITSSRKVDVPPPQQLWQEPLTGMRFASVPAGCFSMGDIFGGGDHNELPVHEACLSPYWIGQHEVTQQAWQAVMGNNPSAYPRSPQHPVDSITQADIATFIERLDILNPGRHFRLPTEAEWEYACRGAGQANQFGGVAPPGGANTAEYADNTEEGTLPVGSFAPNALGLYDMSGNLWEWVSDVYAPDAYRRHARNNPRHQADGPARLLRGGGWSHDAFFARCSKRHMHCRPTARFDFVGFRLVMEAPLP